MMNWRDKLSLSSQFLIAAAVVLCISMAVLGSWINHQITRSVLLTSAESASALAKGLIGPEVQNLLPDGSMPAEGQERLDQIFAASSIAENIVSVKVWRPDLTVIYTSKSKDLIGKKFRSRDAGRAAAGEIVVEFNYMHNDESVYERSLGKALIEIYAPLYKGGTSEIVAVGEVYENAEFLAWQLSRSRLLTWFVVALTTLFMLGFLYLIVRRGSYTIAVQRSELNARVADAQRMADQNVQLRLDANEANEELLSRIGADIHDGPIQVLTLSRFRLDEIAGILRNGERLKDDPVIGFLDDVRTSISNSVAELRQLSTGLVLPELNSLSLRQVIELATKRHENMTATNVALGIDDLSGDPSEAFKICVYRIVQESLTNAFRHAGGLGQKVDAKVEDGCLALSISDEGSGWKNATGGSEQQPKLGYRGIRNRVQAFGGSVATASTEAGTSVTVSLPLASTPRHPSPRHPHEGG